MRRSADGEPVDAMSATAIMQERRRALIRAWMRDPAILVQAEAPGGLAGAGVAGDGGAILRRPGAPHDQASLWIAGGADGRRAYLRFLAEVYGEKASDAEMDGWEVDHLLDRVRAPEACYVRVEAIPAQANRRWAALHAAIAAHEDASAAPGRSALPWTVCARLAGKPPPRDLHDAAQLEHLVGFFASIGLDAEAARVGLLDMLNVAGEPDRRAP